jgi:hypothetical protein
MPATDSSALDGLLKRFYGSDFTDQQQLVPDFLETIQPGPEKPGGEEGAVRFLAPISVRQSGGAQRQNDEFPENETGVKKQFVVPLKINIWPVELTNFALAISKGKDHAFTAGLDREMKEALTMAKKDKNRQLFGGGLGTLALVNGAITASTALVVDTPGVQYFFPGMRIDVWTSVGGTLEASNVKISSIDESTDTLTLASAVTVSNNSLICRAGVLTGVSSVDDSKEVMGLEGLSDDASLFTNIQGLSRSTYPVLNGSVTDANSASLTNDLLQRAADKVERRSGKTVDIVVSHRNQRRQYLSVVTPMKRFMNDKLDSGFQVLEWNGMPWLVSHDCQRTNVYLYNKAQVRKWVNTPLKLDDTGGSTIHKLPRKDVFECYYKSYDCVGTYQPNAVGRIENLATLTE